MKNRKAQLKIQQMTFMILAVTLFLVLAGMFILITQVSGLKQKANILQSDNARLLASKIADSPEFSCGDSYGTGMSSCIDADKVINLKNYLSDYGYGRFWGIQGLQIIKIYPEGNNIECNSSNFPDCGKITIIPDTNGTGISNFVSLCGYNLTNGQSYAQCSLAEIIVYYQGIS